MTSSDYKSSFMLDIQQLDQFIQFLHDNGTELDQTSKYQRARYEVDQYTVLVYQSGIVIFEDGQTIKNRLQQYFESQEIDDIEFDSYRAEESDQDEATGWDETPKGVWLTEDQIDELITRLSADIERKSGEKHERARFVKEDQILVINSNGVVYTIGGFDGIIDTLRSVITDHDPYEGYDRVIILDEHGRWERIGPVCLTLVDITKPDLIDLQLAGVKDDTLSRNTDFVEFMPVIEEHCTHYTNTIVPSTINTETETREDYQEYLEKQYNDFLSGKRLNLNTNTLLIIETTLRSLLDHSEIIEVDRDNRKPPAVGISSTIANAVIDKWKEDWYKKLGLKLGRHNIDEIRQHPKREELGKQLLL